MPKEILLSENPKPAIQRSLRPGLALGLREIGVMLIDAPYI